MSYDKERKAYRDGFDAVTGETGWTLTRVFTRVILPLMLLSVVLGAIGYGLGWFGEAADVAREEYGPRAALQKYEWFVDQSAAIQKMDQDIAIYRQRLDDVKAQYADGYGANMASWPPDVRMQYNHQASQARDDLTAVISQRNNLVREYNAASAKFNWKPFKSKTDLPAPSYDVLDAR